jgi:hypothetical protein
LASKDGFKIFSELFRRDLSHCRGNNFPLPVEENQVGEEKDPEVLAHGEIPIHHYGVPDALELDEFTYFLRVLDTDTNDDKAFLPVDLVELVEEWSFFFTVLAARRKEIHNKRAAGKTDQTNAAIVQVVKGKVFFKVRPGKEEKRTYPRENCNTGKNPENATSHSSHSILYHDDKFSKNYSRVPPLRQDPKGGEIPKRACPWRAQWL